MSDDTKPDDLKYGEFEVIYFNVHGEKLADISDTATTLQAAIKTGDEHIHDVEAVKGVERFILPTRFAINRRVYDSGLRH